MGQKGDLVGHNKELQFDSTGNPLTVLGRGLMWSTLPSPTPCPLLLGPVSISSAPAPAPFTVVSVLSSPRFSLT